MRFKQLSTRSSTQSAGDRLTPPSRRRSAGSVYSSCSVRMGTFSKTHAVASPRSAAVQERLTRSTKLKPSPEAAMQCRSSSQVLLASPSTARASTSRLAVTAALTVNLNTVEGVTVDKNILQLRVTRLDLHRNGNGGSSAVNL